MDPGDQLQPPIAGIQADDPRAQSEQADGELEQRAREGGVVDIGAREPEQQRQAGPAAQQRMQSIAQQEGAWMVGGRVADGGIGIGPAPG
jgi:hypothetical protein